MQNVPKGLECPSSGPKGVMPKGLECPSSGPKGVMAKVKDYVAKNVAKVKEYCEGIADYDIVAHLKLVEQWCDDIPLKAGKAGIGRGFVVDYDYMIPLYNPSVSNRHAVLEVTRGGGGGTIKAFITDLGSTNGTYVGTNKSEHYKNRRITEGVRTALSNNMYICFGNQIAQFAVVQNEEDDGTEVLETPSGFAEEQVLDLHDDDNNDVSRIKKKKRKTACLVCRKRKRKCMCKDVRPYTYIFFFVSCTQGTQFSAFSSLSC